MSHTYNGTGSFTVVETVIGSGGAATKIRPTYITVLYLAQFNDYHGWQSTWFQCLSCPQAQLSADADGTGQNNLFKFAAGLNPTNQDAFVLSTSLVTNHPTWINLTFSPITAGRVYSPQYCTNLLAPVWFPLTTYTGPQTNGNQVTITDTNAVSSPKYYRIDILLP